MLILEDKVIIEILGFLQHCEEIGKEIIARVDPSGMKDSKNSVSYEARLLRILFIKLRE